jgi:hypothetical protein
LDATQFLQLFIAELARHRGECPDSAGCVCALSGSVGALADAVLQDTQAKVIQAAVHVAVVAARVAIEGDAALNSVRMRNGLRPLIGEAP